MGLPGRRSVRLRRQRHHRRQQPVRTSLRARLHPADGRLHRLRRRRRRPHHRQPDRRPPRRRLRQRHDPRPPWHDHIYGDSGINVDILTRGLTVTSSNSSPRPTLDKRNPAATRRSSRCRRRTPTPRRPAATYLRREPGSTRRRPRSRRSRTRPDAPCTITTVAGGPQEAYDDIIFGDHGAVFQQTADPNEPDLRLQKIQTTTISSVRLIESRAYQNGGDDAIFGNLGRDVIVAGTGNDMADGDEADDMVFGDNVFLLRRVVEAVFPKSPTTPAR